MTTAIILASGSGERFGDRQPKQFVKLAGLPIIVHTLKVFDQNKNIDKIIVVTNEDKIDLVWQYAKQYNLSKVFKVVAGGETRQESSKIGLDCCDKNADYVLIHDSVRPFITNKIIDDLVDAVIRHKTVDTVIRSADTIVRVNNKEFIEEIPDRRFLRRGQTPQAFDYKLVIKAHKKAIDDGIYNSTDDCSLVLRLGRPVFTVHGDEQNIKITYPIDLHIADKLFQLRQQTVYKTKDIENFVKDRVFVVIGGTSGIGKSISEKVHFLGGKIYSLSRNTDIKIDITENDSIKKALAKIKEKEKKIDYVINCAGDLIRQNVEFMSINDWNRMFDVNIKGCFLLAKNVIPIFKEQGGGNLMFVGSSAYTRGRRGYAAYSSSKAALVNFVQALSEEVADYNIKVNVAVPSRVATPLRRKNFGKEAPNSLLSPEYAADKIIDALFEETTGSIFDIK